MVRRMKKDIEQYSDVNSSPMVVQIIYLMHLLYSGRTIIYREQP